MLSVPVNGIVSHKTARPNTIFIKSIIGKVLVVFEVEVHEKLL